MSLTMPSGGRTIAGGPAAVLGEGSPFPVALEHVGTASAVPTQVDGPVCAVSFAGPYPGPVVVQLTPANAAAAKAGLYVTSSSGDFTVHAVSAEPGAAVVFHYFVIGVAA